MPPSDWESSTNIDVGTGRFGVTTIVMLAICCTSPVYTGLSVVSRRHRFEITVSTIIDM